MKVYVMSKMRRPEGRAWLYGENVARTLSGMRNDSYFALELPPAFNVNTLQSLIQRYVDSHAGQYDEEAMNA